MLRTYRDEDGNDAQGGAHVTDDRPGGGVDPVELGWQRRYMNDDVVQEVLDSGHNVIATVFVECGSMYRASGPVEMRCVGETEVAHGIATMSASGS